MCDLSTHMHHSLFQRTFELNLIVMASFASPVGILTMEERREFNIARNNDFLKNLFGLRAEENSTNPQPVLDEVVDDPALTTQESTKARDREILYIKNDIKADFPSRELETEQIFGYLSDVRSVTSISQHPPRIDRHILFYHQCFAGASGRTCPAAVWSLGQRQDSPLLAAPS